MSIMSFCVNTDAQGLQAKNNKRGRIVLTYNPLVSAAAIHPLTTALAEIGLDPSRLLIRSGLDPFCVLASSHDLPKIPNERLVRFSRLGVRTIHHHICQRDGLQPYQLPFFRLMCLCLLSSPTLGDALQSLAAFHRMTRDDKDPVVSIIDGGAVHLVRRSGQKSLLGDDLLSMYGLTSFHRLFSWLIDEEITLIRQNAIYFTNFATSGISEINTNYRCTLNFGKNEESISFDSSYLDKKICKNYFDLQNLSKNFAFDVIYPVKRIYNSSEKVADMLARSLQENESIPTLPQLARILGTSPATLRRRLEAEGLSFMEIRNRCRQQFAENLLSKTNMCIDQIAEAAQFSDISSFRRSFKNLTGFSPSAYRASFSIGR